MSHDPILLVMAQRRYNFHRSGNEVGVPSE